MSLITVTQTVQQQISAIACNTSGCGAVSTNTNDSNWAHILIPVGSSWAGNQRPQYDFCSLQHMLTTLQSMRVGVEAEDDEEGR